MEELGRQVRDKLELGLWREAVEFTFMNLKLMNFDITLNHDSAKLDKWARLMTSQVYALLHFSKKDLEELEGKIAFCTNSPALEALFLGKFSLCVLEPWLETSDFLLPTSFDLSILVGESLLLYMSQHHDEKQQWLYAAYKHFKENTAPLMRKLAKRYKDNKLVITRFTSTIYSLCLCFDHTDIAKEIYVSIKNKRRMDALLNAVEKITWTGNEQPIPDIIKSKYEYPEWTGAVSECPHQVDEVDEEQHQTSGHAQIVDLTADLTGLSIAREEEKTAQDIHRGGNENQLFCANVHKSTPDIKESLNLRANQNVKLIESNTPIEVSASYDQIKYLLGPEVESLWGPKESTKVHDSSRTWALKNPPKELFIEDYHTTLLQSKGTVEDSDIMKLWNSKKRKPAIMQPCQQVLNTNLDENSAYHARIYAYKHKENSWTYRRLLIEIQKELAISEDSKGASRDVIEFDLDFWTGGIFTENKRQYVAKRYRQQRSSLLYMFDVKTHEMARHSVDAFNRRISDLGSDSRIRMLPVWHVEIYSDVDSDTIVDYVNIEPRISGQYIKFTNNHAYVNQELPDGIMDLMMAFSHFSYDYSGGDYVVTDLQGWLTDGVIILTDPALHTRGGSPNVTDMAHVGMKAFWKIQHPACNDVCRLLGLNHKRPE